MKIKQIKKEIKGIFKQPIKKYYLGKIRYYTPYFKPRGFSSTIIRIRKLILKSPENYNEYIMRYPHLKNENSAKFINSPMIRRNKNWTIKLFGHYWYIDLGWPFAIAKSDLGWKDKFNLPRWEWNPFFQIWLFKWQFVINWTAPDNDEDAYWEQVLWFLKYSDKNINRTIETWPWTNFDTEISTWDNKYLINEKDN